MNNSQTYKTKLSISLDKIDWARVLDLLLTRHKLSYYEALNLLTSFQKRVRTIAQIAWFANNRLSKLDNMLLSAIGETHSADCITVFHQVNYSFSKFLSYQITQEIKFNPNFRMSSDATVGTKTACIWLKFGKHNFRIHSLFQVVSLIFCLAFIGSLSTALMLGLALYGTAVFLLFLQDPLYLTANATNQLTLGLALLCFLVGVAGICGKSVRNLYNLAKKWLFNR